MMTKRSYDTMAEAHVEELDAEAVIHDSVDNDSDDEEDDDEDEDDIHDEGVDDDNSDDVEEDDGDEEEEVDVSDDEESVVPTPDEVVLEYTYPDDFQGQNWYQSWRNVVEEGRYYRLIIDCKNSNITEMHDYSFFSSDMLIEVVFLYNNSMINENHLVCIGRQAFSHCHNLQRITNGLPLGLIELGVCTFLDCNSLPQEFTIPRTVRIIRSRCFDRCMDITSVVFGHLPTDTVELLASVFTACYRLDSVTLPQNLALIPEGCFRDCFRLTNIPIPLAVREIENTTFSGCTSLRSIDLSENITGVHEKAYAGCTSLETVTIKSTAVQFGRDVFGNCPSLTTIKMYPWVLPRLFEAMNTDPSFCYKLLRQSQYQLSRFQRDLN